MIIIFMNKKMAGSGMIYIKSVESWPKKEKVFLIKIRDDNKSEKDFSSSPIICMSKLSLSDGVIQ